MSRRFPTAQKVHCMHNTRSTAQKFEHRSLLIAQSPRVIIESLLAATSQELKVPGYCIYRRFLMRVQRALQVWVGGHICYLLCIYTLGFFVVKCV